MEQLKCFDSIMKCKKCGSKRMHRRGFTDAESQRWACYNCNNWQTEKPKEGDKKLRTLACPRCSSERTKSNGTNRQKCLDCKRSWTIQ